MTTPQAVTAVEVLPFDQPLAVREGGTPVVLQTAGFAHVEAIHSLISESLAEGHLLPRTKENIGSRIHRFLVALRAERVVACAELAPLSGTVAEIRSLVVCRPLRGLGIGTTVVRELVQRAEAARFKTLCAFTHSPGHLVRMGFSLVPHVWLPEKVATDCHSCSRFRRCGQQAVVRSLEYGTSSSLPQAALHG